MTLKAGDKVRVKADNRSCEATVIESLADGRCIKLSFNAILGGWLGEMPAFLDEKGQWKAINGMLIDIVTLLQ